MEEEGSAGPQTTAQAIREKRRELFIKENGPKMGEETAGSLFDFKESARDLDKRVGSPTGPELSNSNLNDAGTLGGASETGALRPNLNEGTKLPDKS